MKALIRNEGETVTEADGIPGIDWNTGMPLTNPDWAGGPYILINDYIPGVEADFAEDPEPAAAEPESEDTVVIDGVVYRRA